MSSGAPRAPLFSVIIPTFNRSDLLPYAIRSVLKQTFGDFEILVCDNASTDDTPLVVKQCGDSRVRYVRTPRHFVIADNWEFGRSHAAGTLILMLSDDDALAGTALEHFAEAFRRYEADFLFCAVAEYRDRSFSGSDHNSLRCRPFSSSTRRIDVDRFLKPLFSCSMAFDMHPSAFVFRKALANTIAARCGRFFQTNGVEYCAWPLAAVLANLLIYIDVPLVICGRTAKSWGTNMVLANPGPERIGALVADVEQRYRFATLRNFTMVNLRAEGILTAKHLLPEEFASYEFQEVQYLREAVRELKGRQALGVDVSAEMADVMAHLRKYPSAAEEPTGTSGGSADRRGALWRRVRSAIGALGGRRILGWLRARRSTSGSVHPALRLSGAESGFQDILQCADVLTRVVRSAHKDTQTGGSSRRTSSADVVH